MWPLLLQGTFEIFSKICNFLHLGYSGLWPSPDLHVLGRVGKFATVGIST